MKKCAFCNIADGVEDAHIVYENESVLAFLHIAPVNKGHVLVIPREHFHSIVSIPHDILNTLTDAARRVAVAVMRATGSEGFDLIVANGTCAGQLSPHAYIDVIPRWVDDGITLPARCVEYADETEKTALINTLRERLKP